MSRKIKKILEAGLVLGLTDEGDYCFYPAEGNKIEFYQEGDNLDNLVASVYCELVESGLIATSTPS